MKKSTSNRRVKAAPRASVLIESMRDIGYSLHTAIADVIDNSITAGAVGIELLADTASSEPAIGILDDGKGMSEEELLEAMRPGSQSPLVERENYDLGRFGLGLKTASFSQCRRVSVVTRSNGITSCAIWDLDTVVQEDEWYVELPNNLDGIPWAEKLNGDGTLVVWQKLDRLLDPERVDERQNLVRQIDESATHVELVFHRFLSGEPGTGKISILLNDRPLVPYDPFNSKHPATVFGPEDVFLFAGKPIKIQPVTLPHHKKVSAAQWNHFAGKEGYIKNQGFYVYRERRLIIHGTWFGLAKQTELTKLARVRIDMPNSMDADWKIDVKKASAQPPAPVRDRLRRIIETIGATSKRVYTKRGRRLVEDNRLPVWTRNQNKNAICYAVNTEHPVFQRFSDNLTPEMKKNFADILGLIGSTIPVDTLFSDVSSNPENVTNHGLEDEAFRQIVNQTFLALRSGGITVEDVKLMMSSADPFRSNWKQTEWLISEITGDRLDVRTP